MLRDRFLLSLLAVHVFLLAFAAISKSPANHEAAQLPAGLIHWKFQQFDVAAVNPPLVRMVAAIPVSLMRPLVTWRHVYGRIDYHAEYAACQDFISQNGERSINFYIAGRFACIPFSLIGACACYQWARELFNRDAGLVAASLWCFSPSVLGEGSLITSDVAAAAFGLMTTYQFCKYLSHPGWANAVLLGISTGLSISTKFTWLVVLPIVFAPFFVVRFFHWNCSLRQVALACGHMSCVICMATFLLNAAYGFCQSPTKLGDMEFVSKALTRPGEDQYATMTTRVNRFRGTWLEELMVPVPSAVLKGIDVQKRDFELDFPSYLMGKWKHGGWWYFYLIAFCVKSPESFVLLLFVGVCVVWKRYRPAYASMMLLYAPAVILAFVCLQTGINQHMRYILPALPFGFVAASSVVTLSRKWKPVYLSLLVFQVVSVIACAPHWTSYFNISAGGPANGPYWLLHSNVDAGQDLLILKRWQDDNLAAEKLYVASSTFYDPRDIGIEFELPPPFIAGRPDITSKTGHRGPQAGWYAMSVAQIFGQNIPTADGHGGRIESDGHFTYFKYFRPTTMCGYSIIVYHITEEQASAVRGELTAMER